MFDLGFKGNERELVDQTSMEWSLVTADFSFVSCLKTMGRIEESCTESNGIIARLCKSYLGFDQLIRSS